MEICLWDWYWWSSCNGGITFRFSKKFPNLLLNQEIHSCVIHRCALASGTLPTFWKLCWIPRQYYQFHQIWKPAHLPVLKNTAWIRHTKFYSTRLYPGYRKETVLNCIRVTTMATKSRKSQHFYETSTNRMPRSYHEGIGSYYVKISQNLSLAQNLSLG